MKDLEPIVNDDRLAFAEMAQSADRALKDYSSSLAADTLAAIKKQCEDRIVAIDKALGDT